MVSESDSGARRGVLAAASPMSGVCREAAGAELEPLAAPAAFAGPAAPADLGPAEPAPEGLRPTVISVFSSDSGTALPPFDSTGLPSGVVHPAPPLRGLVQTSASSSTFPGVCVCSSPVSSLMLDLPWIVRWPWGLRQRPPGSA